MYQEFIWECVVRTSNVALFLLVGGSESLVRVKFFFIVGGDVFTRIKFRELGLGDL